MDNSIINLTFYCKKRIISINKHQLICINEIMKGCAAMLIYQLGWHWKHKPDFVIERPNGHYGTQILLIQSKARIRMGDNEFKVDKNTVFVVKSCMPHCLYAVGEEYCDDWIRFSIEQEDNEFIDGLAIDFNVPIKLKDDAVSKLIAACEDVFNSESAEKKETLHHLMSAIMLHISAHCRTEKTGRHTLYDNALEDIRRSIYSDPATDWNIPDIAEQMNISVPHFQRLYKSRYGIPCTKDIWMSRMDYARQLLLTTDLSANEIAEMCGYQDYAYFSRSFVKYACVSPAKYRSQNKEK